MEWKWDAVVLSICTNEAFWKPHSFSWKLKLLKIFTSQIGGIYPDFYEESKCQHLLGSSVLSLNIWTLYLDVTLHLQKWALLNISHLQSSCVTNTIVRFKLHSGFVITSILTDKETIQQQSSVSFLRSHRQEIAELGFKHMKSGSRVWAFNHSLSYTVSHSSPTPPLIVCFL